MAITTGILIIMAANQCDRFCRPEALPVLIFNTLAENSWVD
jgi:hypothetical protein